MSFVSRIVHRRVPALVIVAALMLVAVPAVATAQAPAPPPALPSLPAPGTPPVAPPALPTGPSQPQGAQPAPAPQPAPTPQTAKTPSAAPLAQAAKPHAPSRLVQLTGSTARLRGDVLTFSVRCQRSADVTLTRGGHRIGSTRVVCRDFAAAVRVSVTHDAARAMRHTKGARVAATFRAGSRTVHQVLRVGTGTGRRARAAELWFSGATSCGNQYSYPYGLRVDPGYLSTFQDAGQPDYAYYKVWGWTSAEGWFSTPWSSAYYVAQDSTVANLSFDLGTKLAGSGWTAWAVEKYWWYGGQHQFFYLGSESAWFGNYTSGYWCYQ